MAKHPGGRAVPNELSVLSTSRLLSKTTAWAINSMGTLNIDKVVYVKEDKLNESPNGGVLQKYPSRASPCPGRANVLTSLTKT